MRIVWKDTVSTKQHKPVKYRKYTVSSYVGNGLKGWTVDIPGDQFVYRTHYHALNRIDQYLGGTGVRGSACTKRQSYGIEIAGKIEEEGKNEPIPSEPRMVVSAR